MNLAKHPASTVQILGAEKALFKALKTKHDTPKYGLIYHAQLVGQSATALKGKVSRMLAAKASLACRVDALSDEATSSIEIGRYTLYFMITATTAFYQGTFLNALYVLDELKIILFYLNPSYLMF